MPASLVLAWRDGVSVAPDGAGQLVVQGPAARASVRPASPALRAALDRLAPPGEDEDRLAELVSVGAGPPALARWYYYVERLIRRGLLGRSAHADGQCLATLVAVSPAFAPGPGAVTADRSYVLSRFAYLRREGGTAVLESPRAHARVVLTDCRAAALVGALAAPATAADLAGRVPGLGAAAVGRLLALLIQAAMVQAAGPDGLGDEDGDPAVQAWEFHDLLFHARSRKGRSDAPFGGTYRLAGRLPPPPALRPAAAGPTHDLYRPDLGRLRRDDPPLARVQEERCSVRTYAARPLTDRQLGEFLYRVARVTEAREVEAPTPHGPVRLGIAPRPYPAGGGLYELEVYVVVNACDGLAPGLYWYDPLHHRLVHLRGRTPEVEQLLRDAGASAGVATDALQVLLVLAARFHRVAWKYASLAYALTLKHVGVVYQTMYLAATAMGLAPCALGGGDADLFARAAGTDYYNEASVGEFLLGSR